MIIKMYTMEYHEDTNNNENMQFAAAWSELKDIRLSEVNQKRNIG